jgi:hypothetical protein
MRTDNPCAGFRREEQAGRGALPHVLIERGGVCGFGIEMSNRLLQPRSDFGRGRDGFPREKAVHLIAQPNFDTAIPKPVRRIRIQRRLALPGLQIAYPGGCLKRDQALTEAIESAVNELGRLPFHGAGCYFPSARPRKYPSERASSTNRVISSIALSENKRNGPVLISSCIF